mmetsp:Transcript_113270/g.283714  ORF Transcript_113270/g.283714 Transcript_113270/m.283714 type:complete len:222 (+) Transcript_113270:609-1274(+)
MGCSACMCPPPSRQQKSMNSWVARLRRGGSRQKRSSNRPMNGQANRRPHLSCASSSRRVAPTQAKMASLLGRLCRASAAMWQAHEHLSSSKRHSWRGAHCARCARTFVMPCERRLWRFRHPFSCLSLPQSLSSMRPVLCSSRLLSTRGWRRTAAPSQLRSISSTSTTTTPAACRSGQRARSWSARCQPSSARSAPANSSSLVVPSRLMTCAASPRAAPRRN